MSGLEEFLLVFGMMIVTFGIRYPILALSGRYQIPEPIERALRFVPVAVLSAFVVPILVAPRGEITISAGNEYLIAGIVSIIIAWYARRLLLTIVLGMSLFLVLRFLF